MSDRDPTHRFDDERTEEEVRRLLEMAGPRLPVPEEAMSTLREVSRERWQARTRWRRRRPWALSGLAAAAALLLAAVLVPVLLPDVTSSAELASVLTVDGETRLLRGDADASVAPGVFLRGGDRLSTRDGRTSIELAEGGSLRLDRETRLRFVRSAVLELETGAVYFDSEGRSPTAVSLLLQTPVGQVTDIGTRFEARVEDGSLRLRVRDGAVSVEGSGVDEVAAAGEELVVTSVGGIRRASIEPWNTAYDWIHGVSPAPDIEGKKLDVFLDWASREAGWQIELVDTEATRAARETVLHGSIDGLDPRAALDLVLPGAGLSYTLERGTLSIRGEAEP